MNKSRLLGALCAGLFSLGSVSTADAALVGRLPATPGGTNYQAYYDTVLDITWDRNADRLYRIGNGALYWNDATDWAANFTLGGVTDWRLPSQDKNGGGVVLNCANETALDCAADNEFHYLAIVHGVSSTTPTPFYGIPKVGYATGYWSSSPVPGGRIAVMNLDGGGQFSKVADSYLRVWAVKDGDVFASSVVPIPAAIWLFGSGLLGLVGMARQGARKRKQPHSYQQ